MPVWETKRHLQYKNVAEMTLLMGLKVKSVSTPSRPFPGDGRSHRRILRDKELRAERNAMESSRVGNGLQGALTLFAAS